MAGLSGGYEIILWIQSIQNPLFDWMAMGASFLGTEAFYLVFVPLFYWCSSKRDGVRLALVFLLSIYFNGLFKELFHTPRPDPGRVRVLYASSGNGYSFPSGHAQNAMVFWGWFGRRQPWRGMPGLLGGLVLLISLSRLYLGLHFPVDVLGGWVLGGFLLMGLVLVDRRISRRPKGWEGRVLPWAGVILPPVLFAFRLDPVQAIVSGAMLGFCLGYLVESRWIQFSPQAPRSHQVAKALGGWITGGLIALALRVLCPEGDGFLFLQYAVLGLWVSLGLPAAYWWAVARQEVDLACR